MFNELLEAMGMASMSSGSESIRLCVFDLRRGQNEGQELDKILFFYPPDLTFSTQLSVIGLSEGLITFTRLAIRDYHSLERCLCSWIDWYFWVFLRRGLWNINVDFSPRRQLVR